MHTPDVAANEDPVMEAVAVRNNGLSMPLLVIGALALGFAYGFVEETRGLGMLAWWIFVSASVLAAAAAVAYSNRRSESFRPALKAMPLLVVALCGLALGDFAAYALEIDGRNLDNYSVSMSWQTNLLVTLSLSVLFGSLLGVLAALLAHMMRRTMNRNAV
jgi:hypothetical protein